MQDIIIRMHRSLQVHWPLWKYCKNEKGDGEDSDGEEKRDNEPENDDGTAVGLENGEDLKWFIDDSDNPFLWHFTVLSIWGLIYIILTCQNNRNYSALLLFRKAI